MRYKSLLMLSFLFLFSCGKEENKSDVDQDNSQQEDTIPKSFKVMSYNIHWGVGIDGKLDLERIKSVIERNKPDIICLNEVDKNYDGRSNYIDEAEWFSDALGMDYVFMKTTWKSATAASGNKPREFGHMILSKFPIESERSKIYGAADNHYQGLLEVKIEMNAKQSIYIFGTHLGIDEAKQASQIKELKAWINQRANNQSPAILMGDLNATPDSDNISYLRTDLDEAFDGKEGAFTFKANNPTIKIDYIFGSGVVFLNSKVDNSQASDHLPIISEVKLKED